MVQAFSVSARVFGANVVVITVLGSVDASSMRAARINSARIVIITTDPFVHTSNLWIAAIGSAFVIIVTILWRGDTSFLQIAFTVQAS